MNRIKFIISFILLSSIGITSYLVIELHQYAGRAGKAPLNKITFTVYPGQSLRVTSEKLAQKNLITHPSKFKLIAKIKGKDKSIKAGEYTLNNQMSPNEILDTLISGKVKLYKFTVPEGYNIRQIAEVVEKKGMGKKEKFIAATENPLVLKELGINTKTLEGYLFPDTYHFPKGVSENTIVKTMVKRLKQVFTPELERRARRLGFTMHQVLTLASIIEKETGAPFERPLISSVFHNRLKKGMRLETDPTVIYGIKNFNGNITKKDLRTPTPYNTYRIKGLPPGPIANPGFDSIEAALYPETTKYLYFVSKKDSTHQFSTNIKDHNKAVRKYQLRRK